MARTLLLLCFLGAAVAQEPAYDAWIAKLADAAPAKSESARRILLNAGTRALPEIDLAREGAPDKETRERLDALAREIREREPFGLQFRCGLPKMQLTKDLVNGDEFHYALTVRNLGTEDVVLYPYLALRVLDGEGRDLKPVRRIGRHGRRPAGCLLEKVEFVTVKPGDAWSFTESLKSYMHDPDLITGWQVPGPGIYTLELSYKFERAAFCQRCPCGAEAHADATKPWNRALELQHNFTVEMKVE